MRLIRAINIFFFVLFSKNKYEVKNKDISDGYNTFNELYEFRMLYNAAFAKECNKNKIIVEVSFNHSDGTPCFNGEYFIVNILLPTGRLISNHYKKENYKLFAKLPYVSIPSLKYDGHTAEHVILRLKDYIRQNNV